MTVFVRFHLCRQVALLQDRVLIFGRGDGNGTMAIGPDRVAEAAAKAKAEAAAGSSVGVKTLVGRCTPKLLGSNLDAPGHDLAQLIGPQSGAQCASACCQNELCGGALFEPKSAVTWHGCKKGQPCCFLKKSVADVRPVLRPIEGGSYVYQMLGRSQDDEKLHFLSATLGSNMVLQRSPQQAMLWGHTAPAATVTIRMSPTDPILSYLHFSTQFHLE